MSRKISYTVISIAAVIGVSAFVLSFFALNDLAVRFGIPARIAFLWPIIVDGLIIAGTVSLLALAQWEPRARLYPWFVFVLGAGVSVIANGYHSYIVIGGSGLSTLTGVMVGAMPPLALLVITHLGVHMIKRQSEPHGDPVTEIETIEDAPHPPPGGGLPIEEAADHNSAEVDPVVEAETLVAQAVGQENIEETKEQPVREPAPVASSKQPAGDDLVAWLVNQEAAGVSVTGTMAAEYLGVSASTGRRRLAKAREELASREPRHLRQVVNQ